MISPTNASRSQALLQTGSITHVRQPRVGMSTKVALEDPTIASSVEDSAPLLKLADALGCLLSVNLSHPPLVEKLSAF